MEITHTPGVLSSRLPGDLQHICSEEDLQPIDLPSLAEYVLTPPAHRHFWFYFAGYSVKSIGQNVKRRNLGLTVNGFLGGLVAITCPCYWVDPVGAFFIGIGGALVVVWALDALEYLRVDDPIGAVPVHLAAGIWGTLSLGLFATGAYGAPTATGADTSSVVSGLFYGGGASQLLKQLLGSGATVIATLAISLIMMYALKYVGVLRVSKQGELEGLDLHEHGAVAYPEYALMGSVVPALSGDDGQLDEPEPEYTSSR